MGTFVFCHSTSDLLLNIRSQNFLSRPWILSVRLSTICPMTNVSGKSAHYLLASCTDPGFPSLDLLPQAHHHALGTVTQSVLPASLVYEML